MFKTGGTRAINLRKFSSKFLRLCFDVILLTTRQHNYECRNLLENLHKFLMCYLPYMHTVTKTF